MLEKDPALKLEFEQKKAQDSAFAQSPQQILNWFYLKSPYGDSKRLVYPVGKVTDKGTLERLMKD